MSAASFVLDTSVTLGALFKDEQDPYSIAVLASMAQAVAVVPPLWHLEMGNILGRALKAGRISATDLVRDWARLCSLGIQVMPSADDAPLWAERMQTWGLSAYDCCYLELSRQQRLPLATKDAALAAAARRFGAGLYLGEVA